MPGNFRKEKIKSDSQAVSADDNKYYEIRLFYKQSFGIVKKKAFLIRCNGKKSGESGDKGGACSDHGVSVFQKRRKRKKHYRGYQISTAINRYSDNHLSQYFAFRGYFFFHIFPTG
jgi:hypothetical protein